jgi:uncharacterized protein (DUF697 family)
MPRLIKQGAAAGTAIAALRLYGYADSLQKVQGKIYSKEHKHARPSFVHRFIIHFFNS